MNAMGSPSEFIVAPTEIREATLADVPFIMALAREKYPAREVAKAEPWARWCITNPDRLVLVGPNSIGCAQLTWKYGYEPKVLLDVLAARPVPGAALEALKMVRMILKKAHSIGVRGTFQMEADTGVDFGPFAKRLGGEAKTVVMYEIPIG